MLNAFAWASFLQVLPAFKALAHWLISPLAHYWFCPPPALFCSSVAPVVRFRACATEVFPKR